MKHYNFINLKFNRSGFRSLLKTFCIRGFVLVVWFVSRKSSWHGWARCCCYFVINSNVRRVYIQSWKYESRRQLTETTFKGIAYPFQDIPIAPCAFLRSFGSRRKTFSKYLKIVTLPNKVIYRCCARSLILSELRYIFE